MKPITIKSNFALLDVLSRAERRLLQRRLENNGPIPITIKGKLIGVFGNHDGSSQEYTVEVDDVHVDQFSHRSDCAIYNGPAIQVGDCDCGGLGLSDNLFHSAISPEGDDKGEG